MQGMIVIVSLGATEITRAQQFQTISAWGIVPGRLVASQHTVSHGIISYAVQNYHLKGKFERVMICDDLITTEEIVARTK